MTAALPRARWRRIALPLLLAAFTCSGLAGCKEKHEPIKPTVAALRN